MQKRRVFFLAILFLSLMFFLSACSPSFPQGEDGGLKIKLNMATFWPGENFYVTEGHKLWIDTVKERVESQTKHSFDVAIFPGELLLGASEIYEGVVNGAADLGSTCPSYTPGAFPATTGLELPGFRNDNAIVASFTMQEAYEQIQAINDEYKDVKVMLFWATGPGDLFTQKPVRKLEDLRGMEIRSVASSVPSLRALGAAPVTMPMGEAYLALNQGIVEGILGPAEILKGFRLAEVSQYSTKTPFLYNTIFMKVMNLETWESLPLEVQEIIDQVNAEFLMVYAQLGKIQSDLGQKLAIEEHKHELILLDAQEEEHWLSALAGVRERWISQHEKKGMEAREILDQLIAIEETFSEIYGSEEE